MSDDGAFQAECCLTINEDIAKETDAEWEGYLSKVDDQVDPTKYRSRLRDIKDSKNTDPMVLALVKGTSQVADALLEISHIKHGKDAPRKKVLDICLHPRFDVDAYNVIDAEFMRNYSDILRDSIVCSLELIFGENPANELRLYGRTDYMYGYFLAIASEITRNGGIEGLAVFCQGRWLVFKKEG